MTTLTLPRRREREKSRGSQIAEKLADAAGWVIGPVWRRRAFLPGLAGAGLVSWGAALVYLPAGVILGGVCLLAMDRQIKLGPRGE